jgi:acetyl-CoA synthetase
MATDQTQSDTSDPELERELASLLDVELSPVGGVPQAGAAERSEDLRRGGRRLAGLVGAQAEELHWFKKWDTVLDDSNPPFYKWFVGGKLNVSYNCLDRHVEAGRGDRVAFNWLGEDGEERKVTYADLLADVERFANALKESRHQEGRCRRDLPADDPRGGRRDARLRADRRAAQRRLRRLRAGGGRERMEFSEAKALITVDGASRKGTIAPIKQAVDS